MRVLPLFLIIGLTSPCPIVQGQQRTPDEAAIRKCITALETALNAHDASGGARLFAEDGDQIVLGSARYRGRTEIERAYREGHLLEMPSSSKDRAFYVMVRRGGSWQIAALRVHGPESS